MYTLAFRRNARYARIRLKALLLFQTNSMGAPKSLPSNLSTRSTSFSVIGPASD